MTRPLLRRSVLTGLIAMGGASRLRAGQDTVNVFAAASLKTALDEIAKDFRQRTGQQVRVTSAGSSILARQITQGAPADIFISANPAWMEVLTSSRPVRAQTELLGNRLVLIAGPGFDGPLQITPGFPLDTALGRGRLAMALVDAVPAGIYGREALTALGVWDSVMEQVAQTDNVRAALRLVATGAAPLGIVYATDAQAEARVRVLDVFPEDSHAPIRYPAALLKDTAGAAAFWSHLTSDEAAAVFTAHGFQLLEGAG